MTLSDFIAGKQPTNTICLQVAARGVVRVESGESHQSCPPRNFKASKLHIVYPIHLPLCFLIPISCKGQQYLKKMKPALVALQEEAINLYIIICNYFRSNNPFVQTFLRSSLSRGREWKVGETGKKSPLSFWVLWLLLLLCRHCPAKVNGDLPQPVSRSPAPTLARSQEELVISTESLWALREAAGSVPVLTVSGFAFI